MGGQGNGFRSLPQQWVGCEKFDPPQSPQTLSATSSNTEPSRERSAVLTCLADQVRREQDLAAGHQLVSEGQAVRWRTLARVHHRVRCPMRRGHASDLVVKVCTTDSMSGGKKGEDQCKGGRESLQIGCCLDGSIPTHPFVAKVRSPPHPPETRTVDDVNQLLLGA